MEFTYRICIFNLSMNISSVSGFNYSWFMALRHTGSNHFYRTVAIKAISWCIPCYNQGSGGPRVQWGRDRLSEESHSLMQPFTSIVLNWSIHMQTPWREWFTQCNAAWYLFVNWISHPSTRTYYQFCINTSSKNIHVVWTVFHSLIAKN